VNAGRVLRADLIIATLALLISGGATISSLYQTKVIANQLSSSVWPYLAITSSTTTGQSYALTVTNDGLGPALVGSATLSLDGHALKRYRDGEVLLGKGVPKGAGVASASFSSIGPTTVIRAGEDFQVTSLRGSIMKYAGDLGRRAQLAVCYCSLLGQCWTVKGQEPRVTVSDCASHAGIDY
jgi:hypothetical protein